MGIRASPASVLQAVREAVSVPVLANGNIRTLHDVQSCLEYTGCAGVMSAESLLEDPALFSPQRLQPGGDFKGAAGAKLLLEYLDLAEQHPTPMRMVTGHAFKMLGEKSSYLVGIGHQSPRHCPGPDSVYLAHLHHPMSEN